MSIDTRLAEELARAAEPAGDRPLSGPAVRLHARRRAQRLAAGAVAAFVLLAGVAALPFVASGGAARDVDVSGTVSGAGYLSWPARGDLAGDPAYETAAVRSWDSSTAVEAAGPHTEVRVLYAAGTDLGPVVVVTGNDARGDRRVALLWGAPYERRFSGRLQLVADRAAPPPSDTRALTFWPRTRAGDGPGPVVIVAEPSVNLLEWAPYDSRDRRPMTGSGGAAWAMTGGVSDVEVTGSSEGRKRFSTRPSLGERLTYPPGGRRCDSVRCGGLLSPELRPTVPWEPDREWFRPVDEAGWPAVREAVLARVDAQVRGQAALWTGRLPDETDVYATVVDAGDEPPRLFVAARRDGYVEVLVDRAAPGRGDADAFAVVVRGETGDWLVFATGPGVTSVEYAPDGRTYGPVELRGGAMSMAYVRGGVPERARWRVRYSDDGVTGEYKGPLDAYGPLRAEVR